MMNGWGDYNVSRSLTKAYEILAGQAVHLGNLDKPETSSSICRWDRRPQRLN